MKILYHHRTASKDGQAVHIEEMLTALRELGHEVRVVAPAEADGAGEHGGQAMGAEVGWVQRLRACLPAPVYECLELGYSLLAYWRLRQVQREFQPDILYERYNLFLLAGWLLSRRTGLPLVLEVNAPLAEERARYGGLALPGLARWTDGKVWRGAAAVLPVTRVLADHLQARGVQPERLHVIPNGINEAHFGAAPAPAQAKAAFGWDNSLVLGFAGFVREWHGVDRVIRWLAGPSAPAQARLLVVGDGPVRADLERLALDLGLGERVHFTGVVPRERVPALVAAFDVALQPAVVPYASPLKMFEYLALGKAIVAPRQPNIEEILVDGENALLFDPALDGSLEQALSKLCADAGLREQVSAAARATIRARGLTWLENARRVTALSEQLIGRDTASSIAPRPAR